MVTTEECTFAGAAASAREVRQWAGAALRKAGVDAATVTAAEQVLAELAANAVEHTRSGHPGGTFHVLLRVGLTRLRLEVTDQGSDSREPRAKRSGPATDSGHGLDLVDAYTTHWWTRVANEGRTVFAEVEQVG